MRIEETKKIRLTMGLKQDEFAKAVGVSRATVSNWERGFVVPDPDNIKKLIEFCKANKIRITR